MDALLQALTPPNTPKRFRSTEHGVIALKYLDAPEIDDGYFGVWWDDEEKSYTEESWATLSAFGDVFLRHLMENRPGHTVRMTGKRRKTCEGVPDTSDLLTNDSRVPYQDSEGYCTLNSVRNLTWLPPTLVTTILAHGPTYSHTDMSRVLLQTAGCPMRLEKVKGVKDKLLFLLSQRSGKFLVYFQGHCLSWDATNGRVLDTDPEFPVPLPATAETICLLRIVNVTLLYRLVDKNR